MHLSLDSMLYILDKIPTKFFQEKALIASAFTDTYASSLPKLRGNIRNDFKKLLLNAQHQLITLLAHYHSLKHGSL